MRINKKLTCASAVLPYPKPSNEYPIMIREDIIKRNDEVFNNYQLIKKEPVFYYWEKEKYLFTKTTLRKRGELPPTERDRVYAQYDVYGHLEKTGDTIKEFITDELRPT